MTLRRRSALRAGLLATAVLTGASCGGGTGDAADPVPVADAAVPEELAARELTIVENAEPDTREAFGIAGGASLIDDGRIWEIRRGERLVGVIQVSTAKAKLDLREADQRDPIVREIIPSTPRKFVVEGTTVHTGTTNRKAVFLWFGRSSFTIAQFSTEEVEPEPLVTELVNYQLRSGSFAPLPSTSS